MDLPPSVQYLLRCLNDAGHEAFAVGGCVRDILQGRTPRDWDICTSALPEEVHSCFSDLRTVDTGIAHGTVTVLLSKTPYEVTTFRREELYADHRHPDGVTFVRRLSEDLARRDFTINAMAVGMDGVVRDPYGGQADLDRGLIRSVGNPSARFQEDALRILRALRFASQLDFTIDPDTEHAAREQKQLLRYVSGERIFAELNHLLVGPGAARVLRTYPDLLVEVLPEIAPCIGFQQHNPCHDEDVWNHTCTALSYSRPDRLVRWALLLHDIGKPETFKPDADGVGHFKGHPARSRALAEEIFQRLHSDKDTRVRVCRLVYYHDAAPPTTQAGILRWMREFGPQDIRRLIEVRRCDGRAHTDHPKMIAVRASTERFAKEVERISSSDLPCSVRDLNIRGRDLMELGVPEGRMLGETLNRLLEAAMSGQCENERSALLHYYEEHLKL